MVMIPAMQVQVATDQVFAALADPPRRAIFEHLARDGEQNVRSLTARAGVSQPAVSKHLGILKHARLVRDRRTARGTPHSAHPQALKPLLDWMGMYPAFWHDRFERLESLLKRMDQ